MKANRFHWLWLVVCVGFLSAGLQPSQALMISEIMYNPVDEQLEYVEIHNPDLLVIGGISNRGDAEALDFPDNSFDAVISTYSPNVIA